MAAPTTRHQPASSLPPSGQPTQAQAQHQAHNRRKARAKAKSEALRQREAAQVETLPVQHPHAAGIGALSNLSEGRFLVTSAWNASTQSYFGVSDRRTQEMRSGW